MEEAVAALSASERSSLLKMIVDHPDLQPYLHPEAAGRVPVKVKSNQALGSSLSLEKFGQPVRFVASSEGAAVLEVLEFRLDEDRVAFSIFYEVEGLTLRGTLVRRQDQWTFEDVEAFES